MRPKTLFLACLTTCLLALLNVEPAIAFPPLPSGFYGTVKVHGANVASGTVVSATINGVPYASSVASLYLGETVYAFDIPGDDPGTPGVIEGGAYGDLITFLISGQPAPQAALWQSGVNSHLDLTRVSQPGIAIAANPHRQMVVTGSQPAFTVTVTNTGNISLTAVSLIDALAPDCSRSLGVLDVGARMAFSCTGPNSTDSFTNLAIVTGTTVNQLHATASDTAAVDIVHPAVSVQLGPNPAYLLDGGNATLTVTISNTGDVSLTNVIVTDALAPDCERSYGEMGANARVTYSCIVTGVIAATENIVILSALPPVGPEVTASASTLIQVIHPGMVVVESPHFQRALSGSVVTLTVALTNTGDITLTGALVSSDPSSECAQSVGMVGAGASISYTCTVQATGIEFVNTVTALGISPAGGPITATDTAIVGVIDHSLSGEYRATAMSVTTHQLLTYTFVITNNDPVIAPNVVMSADIPAGSTWMTTTEGIDSGNQAAGPVDWHGGLAPGASHTIVYVVRPDLVFGSLNANASVLSDGRTVYGKGIGTVVVPVVRLMLPLVTKR